MTCCDFASVPANSQHPPAGTGDPSPTAKSSIHRVGATLAVARNVRVRQGCRTLRTIIVGVGILDDPYVVCKKLL